MRVAIIGGGAAGLMAAITAAQNGAQVTLFEKNQKIGRKLYITGKGRCNVTNNCGKAEMLESVPQNNRFLYSALDAFSPADTMAFFEKLGVPLKTERGGRVFPVSDRAADIVDALFAEIKRCGVRLRTEPVCELSKQAQGFCVLTGKDARTGQEYTADRLIIATGGASYPLTGSTGDGYRFAQGFGHTIMTPRPSLVPLTEAGALCRNLMGLSLRNVVVRVYENSKRIYQEQGEMLFTHFGVSGPLILSASAHMRKWGECAYHLEIDLKPALDEKTLDNRLLSDFEKYRNSDFQNALGDLLPRKLIPEMIAASKIDPHKKVHSITKDERRGLLRLLKSFPLALSGTRPLDEAIITAGGICVREVSPKSMESKKQAGLFFAGEILDVDAYTGGFNLQIAWSTGYLAGRNACV